MLTAHGHCLRARRYSRFGHAVYYIASEDLFFEIGGTFHKSRLFRIQSTRRRLVHLLQTSATQRQPLLYLFRRWRHFLLRVFLVPRSVTLPSRSSRERKLWKYFCFCICSDVAANILPAHSQARPLWFSVTWLVVRFPFAPARLSRRLAH